MLADLRRLFLFDFYFVWLLGDFGISQQGFSQETLVMEDVNSDSEEENSDIDENESSERQDFDITSNVTKKRKKRTTGSNLPMIPSLVYKYCFNLFTCFCCCVFFIFKL